MNAYDDFKALIVKPKPTVKLKLCENCDGKGKILDFDDYHVKDHGTAYLAECTKCHGKGWIVTTSQKKS